MRLIIILFLFLQSYNIVAQNEISVDSNFPLEIVAGSDFEINITIKKSDLQNYAIFKQQIPKEFKVEPIENEGADFNFENNELTFVWFRMPKNNILNLKYKITVPKIYKGKIKIGGDFTYIIKNIRGNAEIPVKEIIVKEKDNSTLNAKEINGNKELKKDSIQVLDKSKENENTEIKCYRKVTKSADNNFICEIEIKKGNLEGIVKLTEILPIGFTAESISESNSVFTFANNEITFLWDKIQNNSSVFVAYKIINQDKTKTPEPNITGSLMYILKGKISNIVIENK